MLDKYSQRSLGVLIGVAFMAYAAIKVFAEGQVRSELCVGTFIAFASPVFGLYAYEVASTPWAARWLRTSVLSRGWFFIIAAWCFNVIAWLINQEIIPFSDVIPPNNWLGRAVQPYFYCLGSIGMAHVFVSMAAKRNELSWLALTRWLLAAGGAILMMLAAIIFWHAAR